MGLFQFFDFLKESVEYIQPDPAALDDAGESSQMAARYHKRIVIVAIASGVATAVAGTIACALDTNSAKEARMLFFAPFIFGTMGIIFGVAAACLFSPRAFLEGPVGSKWMGLIGTRNILVARIVCGILAALPIAFGLLVWWVESHRGHR